MTLLSLLLLFVRTHKKRKLHLDVEKKHFYCSRRQLYASITLSIGLLENKETYVSQLPFFFT